MCRVGRPLGCSPMQRKKGSLAPVDMPLGERVEEYSVAISVGVQSIDYFCSAPAITIPNADLLALGAGTATIAVRQVGDWGASRPATAEIILD
jgi:hypothetical protein